MPQTGVVRPTAQAGKGQSGFVRLTGRRDAPQREAWPSASHPVGTARLTGRGAWRARLSGLSPGSPGSRRRNLEVEQGEDGASRRPLNARVGAKRPLRPVPDR